MLWVSAVVVVWTFASALPGCSDEDGVPASPDGGAGGKGTGGKASSGGVAATGGVAGAGAGGGASSGGESGSDHGPGDRCGGPYGPCSEGLDCRSMAIYECFRATRAACPGEVGFCYPRDGAGCMPDTMGATFFSCTSGILPLGTPKPGETCCAPLGTQGAHACKVPDGTTPGCEACTVLPGDELSPPSCEGGTCGRILATGAIDSVGLVADDAGLYWSSREYDLTALDLAEGTTRILAEDVRYVDSIASDGTHLYVGKGSGDTADTMGISRLPLGGGGMEPFAPTARVSGALFVAGDFVYWRTAEQRLVFKPRAGGAESGVGDVSVTVAAASADSVFFQGDTSRLWSAPLGASTPTVFRDTYVNDLVATASHLYWLQGESTQCGRLTSLVQQPLNGGAPVVLTRTRHQVLELFVSGDAAYYWAARPSGSGTSDAIVRVPLDGGPVTAVVGTIARDLLVRGRTLYWIDGDDAVRSLELD